MPELQLGRTVVQRRPAPDYHTLPSAWQESLKSNPYGETKCTMLLTARAHMLRAASYGTSMHANVMDAASRTGCRKPGSHGSEGAQLTLSSQSLEPGKKIV